ncbi:MAG: hypothetical protein PWP28_1827 [Oceanotoga sp.]|uniref:hypothetical protein n=1 Tax=Oceanotoga sp. TaxID=2108366 RepID=UPI002654899A|nr:hypothetical protein [Oceanotoga sp.]MDN5342952.1 hypothetical protein [Oceanotoga sp.]
MKKTLLFLSLLTLTFLLISCTPPIPGGIDGGNTGGNITSNTLVGEYNLKFETSSQKSSPDMALTYSDFTLEISYDGSYKVKIESDNFYNDTRVKFENPEIQVSENYNEIDLDFDIKFTSIDNPANNGTIKFKSNIRNNHLTFENNKVSKITYSADTGFTIPNTDYYVNGITLTRKDS